MRHVRLGGIDKVYISKFVVETSVTISRTDHRSLKMTNDKKTIQAVRHDCRFVNVKDRQENVEWEN